MDPNEALEEMGEAQKEDYMRQIIMGEAMLGPDGDGGAAFSNQFLNDSGEGVALEDIAEDDDNVDDEEPLTNSANVYIYNINSLLTQ
jgi:hypothetical protein